MTPSAGSTLPVRATQSPPRVDCDQKFTGTVYVGGSMSEGVDSPFADQAVPAGLFYSHRLDGRLGWLVRSVVPRLVRSPVPLTRQVFPDGPREFPRMFGTLLGRDPLFAVPVAKSAAHTRRQCTDNFDSRPGSSCPLQSKQQSRSLQAGRPLFGTNTGRCAWQTRRNLTACYLS
jgi:hypothetical protein